MSRDIILKVENLSKQYKLGTWGTGTLSHDLNRFWHKIRGKPDPYLKIGEINDRSTKGNSEYVWALRDINFEVERGEVLGIIGKNGAGKSTLLKILSRITLPTTGRVRSKGHIASLLEVGTGFHPEMTGRENIFLNGAILGMTKAEIKRKFDEIVDFAGVARYVDTPVKRYSSGMKVRLAFAVAAHLEPDILVVDEVLAVGDAEFQKKAIGKMQDISRADGRTVLFVSHDMTAIRNLCKRTILLENGQSIMDGSTNEVVNFYIKKSLSEIDNQKVQSQFIDSITLKNKNLIIGSPFELDIQFKQNFPQEADYLFIGVENEFQQRVFSVGTHLDPAFNEKFKPGSILNLKIDFINLMPGNYKALIAIGTNLPRQNMEVVRDAFSFTISDNDFFGNGVSLLPQQGIVVYKPKWQLI